MRVPTTSSPGSPHAAIPSRAPLPLSATVRDRRNAGTLDAFCSIGLGAAGICYAILRRSPVGFALASLGGYLRPLLNLIERGEIDPAFVITHREPLEAGPQMYRIFRDKLDGCNKVVLRP